jgi:hypothetical protein
MTTARASSQAKAPRRWQAAAGMLLIECLVYLGAVAVVIGVGLAVFYHALDFSRRLRSNADDIVRALRAGEQWRADVRAATGALRLEEGQGGLALHIPQANGPVTYFLVTNLVARCAGSDGRCATVIPAVKHSMFHHDQRGQVGSWRWELELASAMKAARVRPMFTFTAVSAPEVKP